VDELLPQVLSFNEQDVSDKPLWIRFLPPLSPRVIDSITESYRSRLETLLAVDEAVRNIVSVLKRTGTLENTVIIYTSDNGFFQGEHRIATGKGSLYEEAIRVPLMIRGPGLPEGCVLDHLVVNIDLAPTIAELAGAIPTLTIDGHSLVPLLRNPLIPWREDFLAVHWRNMTTPTFAGVRTSQYLYSETSYNEASSFKEEELYDLSTDPFQLENLIKSSHKNGYKEGTDQLRERLEELKTCTGADCF
jgi:arylsulfatase A-like enzyme